MLETGILVLVGRLDLDAASDQFVVPGDEFRQRVPPRLERLCEGFTDEFVVRSRQPTHGIVDDRIREFAAKRLDHFVPRGFVEFGQEIAIQLPTRHRQADHTRIRAFKLDRVRERHAYQHHGEAAVVNEGLVAILRYREPGMAVAIREARPPPLSEMTVFVIDEEVHQARLEKGPRIDAFARAVLQVIPHGLRPADLPGSGEPGRIVGPLGRVQLEGPDQPGEVLPVLAEPRVVRDYHERMLRMEDTGGLHERIDDQRRRRHQRADQVVKNFTHDCVLDRVLQPPGGILVKRPNRVPAAVAPREVKGNGLPESAGSKWRQPAADLVQVENCHLDGGGPEIPVVVSIEPALGRTGPEPLSGNHQVRPGARGRNRSVDPRSRRKCILLSLGSGGNQQREHQGAWNDWPLRDRDP